MRIFLPVIVWALGSGSIARADVDPPTGLAPSLGALTRGEALTSSADGADAVFYNPAGLHRFKTLDLKLVGIEAVTDGKSLKRVVSAGNSSSDEQPSVEAAYRRLNDQDEAFAQVNVNLLELVFPYLALQSFSGGRLSSALKPSEDSAEDVYDIQASMRSGVIAGVGLGFGPLSIGYSQYAMMQSGLRSQPTRDDVTKIQGDLEAGTFSERSAQFRDFTDVTYGSAVGKNAGVMIQPLKHARLVFGAAKLNVGGTKFQEHAPSTPAQLRSQEDKMQKVADDYGIILGHPADLPEMLNAGASLSAGGSESNFFSGGIAGEKQDIEGDYLAHKTVMSGNLGFHVPWEAAKKSIFARFTAPTVGGGLVPCHIGLLNLRVLGAERPGAYSTYGFDFGLHGGTGDISYLTWTLQGLTRQLRDGTTPSLQYGIKTALGLTLVL